MLLLPPDPAPPAPSSEVVLFPHREVAPRPNGRVDVDGGDLPAVRGGLRGCGGGRCGLLLGGDVHHDGWRGDALAQHVDLLGGVQLVPLPRRQLRHGRQEVVVDDGPVLPRLLPPDRGAARGGDEELLLGGRGAKVRVLGGARRKDLETKGFPLYSVSCISPQLGYFQYRYWLCDG